MSDSDADAYVLGDVFIATDGSEFRFTGMHPRLLVRVDDANDLDFYVRIFNHDEALHARGPLSFTVSINRKIFRSARIDTPGDQEFRWPLQDGWLDTTGPIEISVDVDRPWRQRDGRDLGMFLHSIGFERRKRAAVQPAPEASPTQLLSALTQVAAVLFGGAFTFLVSLLLGKTLLKWLRIKLYRSEELFFGFMFGAACLSMIVFCLTVCGLAYTGIFFATGIAIVAIAWRYRAIEFAAEKLPPLPRTWSLLFRSVYGIYAVLYLVVALCPESSPDGTVYHVAFPALYLREHHIPAITTNLLATLSEGVEMLFLFAFSLGRHGAAALVHLLFMLAAPLGMLSYAKRIGSPVAGVVGGLLFFLSPVTAVVGTAAYVDVAAAVVVFTVFYLVHVWRERQQDALLIPAGLLAGFAYAIKYTACLAVVYVIGAVILRGRRSLKSTLRPCAIVVLFAFAMMVPWLVKNVAVVGNPVAPFANRWFPNPYISVSIEQGYVAQMGSLGGLPLWQFPYDITARGAHTQGSIGPVFLLTPLALLALTHPAGRQLLCAAGIFLLPYPAALGARFLLPALTFLALALALAVSRWKYLAAVIVVLHAVLSWPQVIPHYAMLFGAPGPRLEMPDWRAALRLKPEADYLEETVYGEERVDGYGIGTILNANVPRRERVLAFRTFQQAYHSREVLVDWLSAEGVRLGDSVRAARDPGYRATEQHRFSFVPRPVRRMRLLQIGRAADPWSINELRIFSNGVELPRLPQWSLRAFPNPWDVQLAFDNSPLTRWSSGEPASPGMYLELDLGRMRTIDLVVAETPGRRGIEMDLQIETAPGKWQSVGARQDAARIGVEPRLRRAAMENLLHHSVQWLAVNDMDPGARDFLHHQAEWGIRLSGTGARYRLYHLEPASLQPASASHVVHANPPLQLDGLYALEESRFRWTKRKFAITFAELNPASAGAARLVLSLYIPESAIRKLGPIRLTARFGDHVLAPATYRQPGSFTFERELTAQWLASGPNRFEFALDKSIPPTSTDPRELGIIFVNAVLQN